MTIIFYSNTVNLTDQADAVLSPQLELDTIVRKP